MIGADPGFYEGGGGGGGVSFAVSPVMAEFSLCHMQRRCSHLAPFWGGLVL